MLNNIRAAWLIEYELVRCRVPLLERKSAMKLSKLVPVLVTVVLALALMPVCAFANGGESGRGTLTTGERAVLASQDSDIASGVCGTCNWVIDSGGCLTISPTEGTSGVLERSTTNVYDNWPWYDYRDRITSAKFSGSISAKGSTTNMFNSCSELVSINLTGLDTSSATNMAGMFYGCSKLTSLDLSSLDTSSATNILGMFEGCSSLTKLDLSKFKTSNVTNMAELFDIFPSAGGACLPRSAA